MSYNEYIWHIINIILTYCLCCDIINIIGGEFMNDFQKYLDQELSKVSFAEETIDDENEESICYEVANIIQSARKQLKISQKDLSQITGIQQSSISKLESGKYNPSILLIQRIATGLGKKLIIRLE